MSRLRFNPSQIAFLQSAMMQTQTNNTPAPPLPAPVPIFLPTAHTPPTAASVSTTCLPISHVLVVYPFLIWVFAFLCCVGYIIHLVWFPWVVVIGSLFQTTLVMVYAFYVLVLPIPITPLLCIFVMACMNLSLAWLMTHAIVNSLFVFQVVYSSKIYQYITFFCGTIKILGNVNFYMFYPQHFMYIQVVFLAYELGILLAFSYYKRFQVQVSV